MSGTLVSLFAAGVALFLGLMALGRWLKRRAGVPLGIVYQFFALSISLLIPLTSIDIHPEALRAIQACAALSGAFVALAGLKRGFWEYYFQKKVGATAPVFIREVVGLAVVVTTVLGVLHFIYGVRVPGLLTGSGIVAVVIGLAMQETLGNIVAGVSLQFEKPFKTGDWLIVSDRHAEVMEINWRATRLRATDNIYFDIPNSQLTRQTVVNLSYPQRTHAMRIPLSIDQAAPPNRVKDVLLHATANAAGVMAEPKPKVFVRGFGDGCAQYEVKFWLEDQSIFHDIQDAILTNIWYELDRNGIRLAFALRTVRMEGGAEAKEETPQGRRGALRNGCIMQCLDDAQADALLKRSRRLRFGRGEKLIEQGAAGDSMFLLESGEASVLVGANGRAEVVGTLRAGDCLGEMSLLTGERRSATALAKTDCVALEIEKEALAELLRTNPRLLRDMSELLAKRHQENAKAAETSRSQKPPEGVPAGVNESFLARLRSVFSL